MFSGKVQISVFSILVLAGLFLSFVLYRSQTVKDIPEKQQDEINRIISITPSLTECLYALGCGDKIVGVGDFSTYPPDVAVKPRVGGYINPNLEVILTLNPDLVVIQGKHEKMAEFCSLYGIVFRRFEIDNLEDVFNVIGLMGGLLGVEDAADSLCHNLRKGLDEVARKVSGLPRYTVFYSLGHSPGNLNNLFTVGKESFISELINTAGGKNIFDDNFLLYPEISKETLVIRAPEIILESLSQKPYSSDYEEKLRSDWEKFSTLPAVRNNRIHMIHERYLEIPGPRMIQAALLLVKLIHPEAFDDR